MEKAEKHKHQSPKKTIVRIIFFAVLIIGSGIGIIKYRDSQRYETTDDSQLETDISPVSARVSGYISKVLFADNQNVKKGDTLVMIDDREMQIKVMQAEAALRNAKATMQSTKSNASSVQEGGNTSIYKIDELKIQLVQAKADYERYKELLADKSVTQQQFEKTKTLKESLEKQLDGAQQQQKESNLKTNTANEQIKVAESVVRQRQNDLDYANLQLSYTIITAPFDGIVSKKNGVIGQLVQAGQPLCSIVSEQNLWVIANFKETQINKMKIGMKAEIKVDAFSEKVITGRISSFASATGSKYSLIPADNATGNYVKVVQRIPVKIELDKSNDVLKDLKAGMSVYVKIVIKEE
jgi:membrane fusion protein (multidrug efflux system)